MRIIGIGTLIVMAVCCLLTGRLAAQDSMVGKKAGQELNQRPWISTLCWCPAGTFTMGEKPDPHGNARQVDVKISRGFWMGKYEISQAQYQFVMGKAPSHFVGVFTPVESLSWTEASAFCRKLTTLTRKAGLLPKGWEYRLPTEAQWEYACRAGTTTRYSFGNDVSKLGEYAWYFNNSGTVEKFKQLKNLPPAMWAELGKLSFDDLKELRGMQPHPVGQKKPNAWGLCDMHGNVSEWCRDWYQHKLPGGTDPEVVNKTAARTYRGGGWGTAALTARTAYRRFNGLRPDAKSSSLGFRMVLVPTKQHAWFDERDPEKE